MLRLWGRLSSINVRKVVWAAQELGITVQRTDAGGQFGLVREADYLQRNPNGLVPLMEDEETSTVLWESNPIVRYLCARHSPGELYPETLRERFVAEQWMDWQQTTLNPAGRDAFVQWIRTPAAQRDDGLIAASVAAT
ncbi:MAG: glutathione S-transferase, partial [Burkholderiales bacterium RIFCSPHIGHO2_12_FULL_65_48]